MASIHTGGYRDRVFADETQQTGGYRDRAFASDADKEIKQASPALSFTYNGQHYSYSDSDLDTMRRSYASMRKSDAKYAQSSAAAYTNTEFDRKMQSYGLPAWSEWGTVQKYAQGGGLQENYGNLTKDNWAKINELWAKDWEYSLTSEDAARKSMGLAPASYDSMYENTWLDNELKEKGLPPSKLLNGKLGETYNAWVSDTETYNNFMTDVTREWAKMKQNGSGLSFDDALNSVLARSEYGDFISKHYGTYKEEPNPTDEKYLIKDEFGFAMQNDAGEDMYDSAKYREDLVKASAANAKLDADEFAITFEKAQEYYDRNYAAIKAYDDAIDAYKAKGVNPLTATEAQMEEVNDLYSGMQADAYTVDRLFPDANLSAAEKVRLQPYVDKINNIMKTQGLTAAKEYLSNDFKKDIHDIVEQDVVAAFRQQYPETKKTDSEILDDYYKGQATSYGMDKEQSAAYRAGTLSMSDYMSGKVKTDSDAWTFARERMVRELEQQGLPTTKEALEKRLHEYQHPLVPGDYSRSIEKIEKAIENYDKLVDSYYIEAASYAKEYETSTADSSYVDSKFESIVRDVLYDERRVFDQANETETVTNINQKQLDLVLNNATEEEKQNIVYLESKYGSNNSFRIGGEISKSLTDRYIESLASKYSNEQTEERIASIAQWYDQRNGFVKALVAAGALVVAPITQPAESLYNLVAQTARRAEGGDLYTSDMSTWSQDVLNAISGEVQKQAGGVVGTVYQMLPSTIQSIGGMVAAYFTGGATEWLTLLAMGMESYSSTVEDALLAGRTSDQAYTLGLISGTAEVLFEKVSLDKYVSDINFVNASFAAAKTAGKAMKKEAVADLVWDLLNHSTVQGLVEASEEGATSIANLIGEKIVLGYDTDYERTKQHYIEAGYSESEAEQKAGMEVVQSVMTDVELGFISGALMAFGGDVIQMGKGALTIDRSGTKRFLNEVHDLSAISTDEAMEIANKVAVRTADGELTIDGARSVVNAVLKKGGDAATLAYVQNEMTTTDGTPTSVQDVFATAILEKKNAEAKTLATAALRVAARAGANASFGGNAQAAQDFANDVNVSAREYLNKMSETLQTADKAKLSEAVKSVQQDYVTKVMLKSGYAYDAGSEIVQNYIKTLPQQEVVAGSEQIMVKLKQAGMTNQNNAALYSTTMYGLMRAASDQGFTTALTSVFGKGAVNVSSAIQNACLNSTGAQSVGFVDTALETIGIYATMEDTSLAKTLGAGMDDAAFVTSMLAIAEGRKAGSNSRMMFDYVSKNVTSRAALDALAAVTYYDNMSKEAQKTASKYVIEHDDAMMTADERETVTDEQAAAEQNVEAKRAMVASHEQHNTQTLAAADSIVQRHQAASDAVRETETTVDANGNVYRTTAADLAEVAASYSAALSDAINARDNLAQANADRLEGAKAELRAAERKLKATQKKFKTAMNRHAAAYVNMIGSQLEVIRRGDTVSSSEFARVTALAENGTREDLNSIKAKIIASEKRQAVCLGNEIGADVEIVKFTPEWFSEHGQSNGDAERPGVTIDGKVWLNESVWDSRVGYGTDQVIWHEFAHVALLSAKNSQAFYNMAYGYLSKEMGTDYINNWVKEHGEDELMSEFVRQKLTTDPKAVKALCSSAPVMATRLYQWMNRIAARHNNTIPQMASIVKAQKMFAKALRSVSNDAKGNADVTSVERTNDAFATRNELESIKNESGNTNETAETVETDAAMNVEDVDNADEIKYNIDNDEGENVDGTGAEQFEEQRNQSDAGAGQGDSVGAVRTEGDRDVSAGRLVGRGDRRNVYALLNENQAAIQSRGAGNFAPVETDDHVRFSEALSQMRRDNIEGGSVDPKTPQQLEGAVTLLTDDNAAGVAVEPSGNITAVFKNRQINSAPRAGIDLILRAVAIGGDRLDCYGRALVNTYSYGGMVPVARVQYVRGLNEDMDAYIDEMRAKGKKGFETDPDVYFMRLAPGATIDSILSDFINGNTKQYTQEELDALPLFEDTEDEYGYSRAEKFRNDLIDGKSDVETSENQGKEEGETDAVVLPFELPENTQRLIDSFVKGKADHSVDGKVSPSTNNAIRTLIKNQVSKAASAAGITVDADTLNAYAEQHTLPELETSGESWINGYKPTDAQQRTGSSFADLYNSTAQSDAQYYTELKSPKSSFAFDTIQKAINGMSDAERDRLGNPRIVDGKNNFMVARNVTAEGFVNGNPAAPGNRNIAMLYNADKFTDGTNAFLSRAFGLKDCAAAVMPNSIEYGGLRSEARKNGVNVVTYDEGEPSQFDNAVNLAAKTKGVQYFTDLYKDYENYVKQYGAQKPGMNPRVENRVVPNRTAADNRVSKMMRTIAESPFTSDAQYLGMQQQIMNGDGTYTPTTNSKSLAKARADIDRLGGAQSALSKLSADVASGTGNIQELLAIAESLYMNSEAMQSMSDVEKEQLVSDMVILAHDAGTALQLTQAIKRMSPQGRMFYIEQAGKRMAERYERRTGNPIALTLTDEERQAYANTKTQEELDAVDQAVMDRWDKLTEKLTLREKIRNWRYFSMLGNARTHLRNIVGNALMYPTVRLKDTINTGYQRLFGVAQEDRTTTAITKPMDEQTRAYVEAAKAEAVPIMQGVSSKYLEQAGKLTSDEEHTGKLRKLLQEARTDVASAHITEGRTGLGRALNTLSSANSNLLEMEDRFSLGLRFKSAFAQQIQAKGLDVNKITDGQRQQMMNYAMEEALRATFRDANTIADALNKFEKSHKVTGFLMQSIMPFKKTPMNIVKRSVEYSPVGFVQGMYKIVSNRVTYNKQINAINNMNISESEKQARLRQAEASYKADRIAAIDRLSAGTTGSLLTALGFFAASMGWITIGRKDDDSASFETALGRNAYSLNVGDVSIDLSAFAPAAVPLLMGTALYEATHASEKDQSFTSEMIEVLTETLDPITEMSMLSGIADALNGISYSRQDDGAKTQYLSTIGLNAAKSYVGQYVPTVVGQAARVADPYTRSYSAGNEYFASKLGGPEVGSAVKNIQNKIPFAAWLSEPKVDLHGNKVENYTNWGAGVLHVLNNFVLPATIKIDKKNEIDDELVRLYGVTDGSGIFPEKPSRSLGSYDNNPIKLQNDAEYTEYQEEYGQMVYDALDSLMRSKSYERANDTQKSEMIETVISKTKTSVRKLWLAKKARELKNK